MNAELKAKCQRRLLATVSSLALIGAASTALGADNTERPPIWIEFNWNYDQLSGMGEDYLPSFTDKIVQDGFKSPAFAQNAIPYAYGAGASLSFQPEGSDWIFSAAVRYGRSKGHKNTHEQTKGGPHFYSFVTSSGYSHTGYITPRGNRVKFAETIASNSESHLILDFQAGKDLGLGLFNNVQSVVSFGVRYAQFHSRRSANIHADPDLYIPLDILYVTKYHHTYAATSHVDREFRGIGPSVSWNASVPLAGNLDDGSINFDWGINAAELFGRQRTQGHHQTNGALYKAHFVFPSYLASRSHHSGNPDRSRNVAVPNVGGFAGLSLRYNNAKVSLGYRADYFFGAVDGGIDTRKSDTLGFNGPYASISIGLGD